MNVMLSTALSLQKGIKWSKVISKSSRRLFGSDVPATTSATNQAISKPVASPSNPPKSGGSSFFQRLTAFLAGTGVGFGVSAYFIYNELVESNAKLERDIRVLVEGKDK